jgi:8-oxo-dGTP diphosphatase
MPSTAADSAIVNPATIDEDYIHVVAAIIWEQGERRRFLIAQRQQGKHLQGYWEFPGGKLEAGESPRQALQRELREEINILPTQASPYMRVYYRYPDRNILLDTWMVEAYRGDLAPGERQLLRWIEVSQADDYQFPPADLPIIEAIRNSAKAEILRLP